MTGLAVGARVERAPGDVGTVVEAVSDRVRVQWDHGTGPKRPLEWLVLAMVRPESPASDDATIAKLARAYGATFLEWQRARLFTPDDIVEETMEHIAAENALRDAVAPKWRIKAERIKETVEPTEAPSAEVSP